MATLNITGGATTSGFTIGEAVNSLIQNLEFAEEITFIGYNSSGSETAFTSGDLAEIRVYDDGLHNQFDHSVAMFPQQRDQDGFWFLRGPTAQHVNARLPNMPQTAYATIGDILYGFVANQLPAKKYHGYLRTLKNVFDPNRDTPNRILDRSIAAMIDGRNTFHPTDSTFLGTYRIGGWPLEHLERDSFLFQRDNRFDQINTDPTFAGELWRVDNDVVFYWAIPGFIPNSNTEKSLLYQIEDFAGFELDGTDSNFGDDASQISYNNHIEAYLVNLNRNHSSFGTPMAIIELSGPVSGEGAAVGYQLSPTSPIYPLPDSGGTPSNSQAPSVGQSNNTTKKTTMSAKLKALAQPIAVASEANLLNEILDTTPTGRILIHGDGSKFGAFDEYHIRNFGSDPLNLAVVQPFTYSRSSSRDKIEIPGLEGTDEGNLATIARGNAKTFSRFGSFVLAFLDGELDFPNGTIAGGSNSTTITGLAWDQANGRFQRRDYDGGNGTSVAIYVDGSATPAFSTDFSPAPAAGAFESQLTALGISITGNTGTESPVITGERLTRVVFGGSDLTLVSGGSTTIVPNALLIDQVSGTLALVDFTEFEGTDPSTAADKLIATIDRSEAAGDSLPMFERK